MTITAGSINWRVGAEEKTLDLFEFILIITSVIYALAVAQILSGISRLAQTPAAIRSYIAHTLWVIIFFLYIFLIWWATWEFRSVAWTFPQYGYMLIAPTLLFFACSLLIPQRIGDQEVDLSQSPSSFWRHLRSFRLRDSGFHGRRKSTPTNLCFREI
jgi:hypothetical protein